MVLLTRKQLPLVLKLDLYSSFLGGGGGGPSPNDSDLAYFAGFVWNPFVSDFKNKHTVAKPLSLAKQGWLVGENPTRNDSVMVVRNQPTLRRSPRREPGCTPLLAPALGPRRGDKPQCSLNPSHKDTYFQWNCKFSNGIVNFWNGSNSGRERLFDVFFSHT